MTQPGTTTCATCGDVYAAHAHPGEQHEGECLLCECVLFVELPEWRAPDGDAT